MAIFQSSVLKKFLKQQDDAIVAKAYKRFIKYFHDPIIQQNIRDSKEEQFQAKFLDELFVQIFGYTLSPQKNFNLTTEFKNIKNSRKADGAILQEDKALAVIELKSTKTKDLESIRQQAFDYKANQPGCVYVITSNFEKIRFYINNAVDFEEFDLFNLSEERFRLMYLCLEKDNLLKNVPLKIKEASILEEEAITKKFYADYSLFKRELYRDLVKRNMRNDVFRNVLAGEESVSKADKNIKLTLFKKSQKLLDRFLFLFFGEDRGLLPPNSVPKILEQWEKLKELDEYVPLYDRYKKYFNYLNEGWKGKDYEIFAYNGGLFKPDPILDSIAIDDELLFKHTSTLTNYDFESQVDVNILGHIFENSLNEIESVNAEIEGVEFDKQKTKRKKDGVFYTPKYITKYIVDNTVGKLCEEKKEELGVIEDEYLKGRKNRPKATIAKLDEQLTAYRDWLLTITICDPACGSGAFLNQALEFLITEHRWIDEMQAKLLGGAIVFQDIENSILENNIYGVDLNEESVEIAKLSLWLRTAQKGRKLTTLNSNIKCGNSLIDSKSVAGDKAFSWEKEFPEVFAKGGFDVIIGNPPYVRQELFGEIKPFLENKYSVFEGTSDLFAYFYEKGFDLLKSKGLFGFISNTFDKTKAAIKLREHLSKNVEFINYVDFTDVQIFEGATTYPIILIAKNGRKENNVFSYLKIPKGVKTELVDIESEARISVEQGTLDSSSWNFNSIEGEQLLSKLKTYRTIKNQYGKCFRGIVTGFNEAFIIDQKTKSFLEAEHPSSSELIKPFYEGKDLKKWSSPDIDKYIIFTRRGTEIEKYPAIEKYLDRNREKLTPRNSAEIKVGRKPGPYKWFEIQDSVDYFKLFESPKITWPNLQSQNKFSIDYQGYYINAPSVILPTENRSLLCIVNSRLVWFFLKSICVVRSGGYIEVKPQYFEQIPVPEINNEVEFESKANSIISTTDKLQNVDLKFRKYITHQYGVETFSKKLQLWFSLEFGDFMKELNKAIKKVGGEKLSKADEMEWMDLFEAKKKEAMELKTEIDQLDKEIDQTVYELYGLSEEEVKIIEQTT